MADPQEVISLPVVLSEGSERVHVGTVSVHPSVSFRALQSEMSGMIGVPPYQMTAFLERPSRNYRIIPVNEKVLDLSAVAREGAGEWRLLAVVRRPRNGRSRRSRRSKGGSSRQPEDHREPSQIQPEKIILRRNDAGNANASSVYDLMYGPGVTPIWGPLYGYPLAHEIRSVDRTERFAEEEKEEGAWLWRDAWRAAEPAKAVCAVCEAAAKETDSANAKAFQFHCCVRDEILTLTVGSAGRSPVGPIERPSGKRVQGLGCAA